MVCRYSEAIDFLYSCNTFDTRDVDVIAFLPRLLLPHRINAIRNLQILLSVSMPPSYPSLFDQPDFIPAKKLQKARKYDHHYRNLWDAMWNNLSEMEGLVTLMVELNMLGRHDHLWEADDFGCVRWVHGPREVRLVLSDTVARRIAAKVGIGNCSVKSNIVDEEN
jgi:hypothetical protein